MNWSSGKRLSVVLSGIAFATSLWVGVGAAQEIPIVIQGRVQWVSGQVMMLVPDGAVLAPSGAGAVGIDLSQVHQDEYQWLVTGDFVLVTGTVPNQRSRIMATSVQRLPS